MRRAILAIAPLVAGCSTVPAPPASGGAIYHYVRSNLDGSEPEHIVQFRPSRTGIAVYKWVEKCTRAAYVTAEMDAGVREGRRYVAGQVARDGSQAPFGTLILDPAAPALVVDLDPPRGDRIQQRHPLQSRPYLIYDFDFADLNAFLQEHQPTGSFAYELPVVWPSETGLFRDLGRMTATFAGEEQRLGRRTRRFDLAVSGPSPAAGRLWIDTEVGFIVEAELPIPNHQENRDFRLRLERVESGGQEAWDALTAGHYAGCPTGN